MGRFAPPRHELTNCERVSSTHMGPKLCRGSCLGLLAMALSVLVGCHDRSQPLATEVAVDPMAQDRMLRMAEGLVANAAAGDRHRGFESVILSWEAMYPETGGIYFDPESEVVVVVLTDLSREAEIVAAVRQVLGGEILFGRDGAQLSGEVAFTSTRGDYPFSNLVAWTELLTPQLLSVQG